VGVAAESRAVQEHLHQGAPIAALTPFVTMSMVEQFVADVSHGARWLGRHPRFAVLSTLIIAIGVGGSTAIFSVADASSRTPKLPGCL
jgi:hypothetical protein